MLRLRKQGISYAEAYEVVTRGPFRFTDEYDPNLVTAYGETSARRYLRIVYRVYPAEGLGLVDGQQINEETYRQLQQEATK